MPTIAAVRTELGDWKWSHLPAGWVLTLVALVLFFLARALYASEKARAGTGTRVLLAFLRAAIVFLLLLVISGPFREETKWSEERSHLVLLIDASASMSTHDRYRDEDEKALLDVAWPEDGPDARPDALDASRLALVQRVLGAPGEALLRKLDERFILHAFAFDEDWRSLGVSREDDTEAPEAGAADPVKKIADAIRALEPVGQGTRVGLVIANAATEFLGQQDARLAGVLLITDGRDTTESGDPLDPVTGLGSLRTNLHVTSIALGNPDSGRNARMERIRAKEWVLVGDTVQFETAVRHVGFTDTPNVTAAMSIRKVADADGRPLEPPQPYAPPGQDEVVTTPPFTLPPESEPHEIRLRSAFPEAGTFEVKIEVQLPPDRQKEDAVREDDAATHVVLVKDQRIKILFVDRLPRWDWRFLSNWLTREPDETTMRGAGQPELRHRYAAQVLLQTADPAVDTPHSSDLPALKAFPTTRRDLFQFDVIILGDVDLRQLAVSPEDATEIPKLIAEFVKEGGGLALEAGVDYRNPLGFVDTPLRDLLPVVVRENDKNDSDDMKTPFHLELTEAGERHPIFSVVPGEGGEPPTPEQVGDWWRRPDWTFWWLYRAKGGLKPGAVALATARPEQTGDPKFQDDQGREFVAVATTTYGKGRVFWSAIDDFSVVRRARRDQIFGPFWDQVIRHLATYRLLGGNRRYKILTDKESYFVDETATITITALDPDYEPLRDEFLENVHLEGPDGQEIPLEEAHRPRSTLEQGGAAGTYRMYVPVRRPGSYRIWIEAPGRPGERPERAEERFQVESKSAEQRLTVPNHVLLQRIADATEGRVVHLQDLPGLASDPERLPSRTLERVLERTERPQWDKGWVLLLLAALLTVEWALRRRLQMI